MSTTPRLFLGYLASTQAAAEVVYNASLSILDALYGLNFLSRSLLTPPAASNGDVYLISESGSATGEWAGKEGYIAYYYNDQWGFIQGKEGMTAWVTNESIMIRFVSTTWVAVTGDAIFAGRKTADQTFTTWAGITWDAEDRKATGTYDHDNSTNPSEITLKSIGWYQVNVDVAIEQTDTAAYNFSEIKATLGGSDVTGVISRTTTHFGNQNVMTLSLSFVVQTTSINQILKIEVQRASGAASLKVKGGYGRIMIRSI